LEKHPVFKYFFFDCIQKIINQDLLKSEDDYITFNSEVIKPYPLTEKYITEIKKNGLQILKK
ncbi:MAG: hypothetical protein K2X69_05590, partial [Silvanigrellaceae bacterium]|nr:hypothetical protein [Silvanigrellaceae bacterium]